MKGIVCELLMHENKMNDIIRKIYEVGIVPVIKIDDADKAVPLANALVKGGIPVAEVTFRTAAAEQAIRNITDNCPSVLVGAGTILNVEQCKRAVAAGAGFIVSPGYNEAIVSYCIENNISVLPGCSNPSEMTKAYNAGLTAVKFFPAEQSGGITYLKAIAPVFSSISFMPTGGINQKNLNDYLSFNKVFACGGSWMVKSDMIEAEQYDEITAMCKNAVLTMLNFKVVHVGLNCSDDEEAHKSADLFSMLLGTDPKENHASIFVTDGIELFKSPFRGKHGHIAISTTSIDRAMAYLKNLGFAFDESTRKYDAKGNPTTVYFADEISGFAVHLVEKKG